MLFTNRRPRQKSTSMDSHGKAQDWRIRLKTNYKQGFLMFKVLFSV